ncbi:translocation/assembly module TamB domain-containing protein [Gammaproteobacteria bacterium]|nr:translocation/assembly module TamB domain-containing protein [Gammaproteobacteria bacterium]
MRWLVRLLLGLVAIVVVLFALLQVSWVQQRLLLQLNAQLNDSGLVVHVDRLDGLLPFYIKHLDLRVDDADGEWLAIDAARIAWRPLALASCTIAVSELRAEAVRTPRPPRLLPTESAPVDQPLQLPTLPNIVLQALSLPTVSLGEAWLGEASDWSLAGGLDLAATASHGELTVKRLDALDTGLSLNADIQDGQLTLALDGREGDGLIDQMLARERGAPWTLQLTGAAPLSKWQGTFALGRDGLFALKSGVALQTEPPTLGLENGQLQLVGQALPDQLQTLASEPIRFAATVSQPAAQQIAVDGLRLRASNAELDGSLALDLAGEHAKADLQLRIADLTPLGPLLELPLSGAAALTLQTDSSLTDLSVPFALTLKDLVYTDTTIGALDATGELSDFDWREPMGGKLALTARVEGLDLAALPSDYRHLLHGETLQLDTQAAVGEGPRWTLDSLSLDSSLLQFKAEGHGDLAQATIDSQLDIDALQPLIDPSSAQTHTHHPAEGGIDGALTLRVSGKVAADAVDLSLNANARRLHGLPPAAIGLLGQSPLVGARVSGDPQGVLTLALTSLAGDVLNANGTLQLDRQSDELLGSIEAQIDDLAKADPQLAGVTQAQVQVQGTLDAPQVQVRVDAQQLAFADHLLGTLQLDFSSDSLTPNPEGRLQLALNDTVNLNSRLRYADQQLAISETRLQGPGFDTRADLTIVPQPLAIDGQITGKAQALAEIAALFEVDRLSGSAEWDLRFDSQAGQQGLRATLAASNLAYDTLKSGALSADVRIGDALNTPSIDGEVRLRDVDVDRNRIDALSLAASGSLSLLQLDAQVASETMRSALDAGATVAIDEGRMAMTLQRLDGQVLEQPLRLMQPLQLDVDGETISLQSLALSFAGSTLRGEALLAPQNARISAELRDLPTRLLLESSGTMIGGTIDADLVLNGSRDSQGQLTVRGRNIAAEGGFGDSLPPMSLDLDAALGDGLLQLEGSAGGVARLDADGRLSLPLVVDLWPWRMDLSDQRPLDGSLRANADIGDITSRLDLPSQRVLGLINVDARVSGSSAAPRIDGTLKLSDGEYQNFASGTHLSDIQAELVGDGNQLELRQFSAGDNGRGTITGSGSVNLNTDSGFPYAMRLDVRQANLVQLDEVDARVGGSLSVEGDRHGGALSGWVSIDSAAIRIPDKLSSSFIELDVVEVYGDEPMQDPQQAEPAALYPMALDIEVRAGRAISVRGRGLDSLWKGDLAIGGRADTPTLLGDLTLERGTLNLLDKRFQLRRGEINFFGEQPPRPWITVEAEARSSEIVGVVGLDGPVTDPSFTLTSEPPLPEDEILAQLLFQRDTDQLSAFEALTLASAVRTLTTGGGPGIVGRTRDKLGLDTLDVGDQEVRAGKYLDDDIFLEVGSGVGENSDRATIEWRLSDRISLQSSIDDQANTKVGVTWSVSY